MKETLKKSWPILTAILIIAVIFNVISFAWAGELNSNFWCGYVFIMISWTFILINVLITTKDFVNGLREKALFIKAPSILASALHFGIQFILGIAVMAIPTYSVKLSASIQIIILAVYACIILALVMYERKIKK